MESKPHSPYTRQLLTPDAESTMRQTTIHKHHMDHLNTQDFGPSDSIGTPLPALQGDPDYPARDVPFSSVPASVFLL